jgi:hypothetical protein
MAQATDFYIGPSGCGNNNNTGLTQTCGSGSGPFSSYLRASQKMAPGDEVHYLPGTYNDQINLVVGGVSHTKPSVVDCVGDKTCLIIYTGKWQAIEVNSSHNLIGGLGHGLSVQSLNGDLPLESYNTAVFDTTIAYNFFANSMGGAIAMTGADYTFIFNNGICCSGQGLINQSSGVAVGYGKAKVFTPKADLPNVPYGGSYRTVISGNYSYGNVACHTSDTWSGTTAYAVGNTVYAIDTDQNNYQWTAAIANTGQQPSSATGYWTRGAQTCPTNTTDGEGFIIDTNNTMGYSAGPALVENNISAENGGRGIECFRSSNVTFRNNTSWGSNTDPTGSMLYEIGAENCSNFVAYKNIAGVTQTKPVNGVMPAAFGLEYCQNCKVDWNIGYQASGAPNCYQVGASTCGPNNSSANPMLANPLISLTALFSPTDITANFTPQPGSPAIGWGNNPALAGSIYAGGGVDAGAVQVSR